MCLNLSKRVVDTCKSCIYSVPALLSGTLKTFQKAACDDQQVSLRCPAGTCISVLIAQYGNSAKDLQDLCPEERGAHPRANLTCLWPTSLQVNINCSLYCRPSEVCKSVLENTPLAQDQSNLLQIDTLAGQK